MNDYYAEFCPLAARLVEALRVDSPHGLIDELAVPLLRLFSEWRKQLGSLSPTDVSLRQEPSLPADAIEFLRPADLQECDRLRGELRLILEMVGKYEQRLQGLLKRENITSEERQTIVIELDLALPSDRASSKPEWIKDAGELRHSGGVIRIVRVKRATNIVKVLDCFQDDDWPTAIDDPLPKSHGLAGTRRHEAVKSLNRNLKGISFHVIEEKIIWKYNSPSTP